jgi:hypothetical protein
MSFVALCCRSGRIEKDIEGRFQLAQGRFLAEPVGAGVGDEHDGRAVKAGQNLVQALLDQLV